MKKINLLISVAHWDERILDLKIFKKDRVRLFIDSGAYTNFTSGKEIVNLDSYTHFLKEHKSIIWKYINLDKIGDAEQSDSNLRELESRGFEPIPVFTKSTKKLTPKERFESLHSFSEKYDFIALGGIAGKLKKKSALEYTFKCCYHLKRWKKDVHILGCGNPKILQAILPFSADSSSSTNHQSFGQLNLFLNGKFYTYMSPRKKGYRRNKNTSPLRAFNLHKRQVEDPKFWESENSSNVSKLSIESYFRFQAYLLKLKCNYFQALLPAHMSNIDKVYWRMYA